MIVGLNNRRSEVEILASILDESNGGSGQTKIMYRANMSYSQLKNYLNYLKEKELLKEEMHPKSGRKMYSTSEKGLMFLSQWENITPFFE